MPPAGNNCLFVNLQFKNPSSTPGWALDNITLYVLVVNVFPGKLLWRNVLMKQWSDYDVKLPVVITWSHRVAIFVATSILVQMQCNNELFSLKKMVIICTYCYTSFSKWEKFKKRMNFSRNQDTMEKPHVQITKNRYKINLCLEIKIKNPRKTTQKETECWWLYTQVNKCFLMYYWDCTKLYL